MKPKATLVVLSNEIFENYFISGVINTFIEIYDLSILCDKSLYLKINEFINDKSILCRSYSKDKTLVKFFDGSCYFKTKQKATLCRGFNLRLRRTNLSILFLKTFGFTATIKRFFKNIILFFYVKYFSRNNYRKLIKRIKKSDYISQIRELNPKYLFIPCFAISYEIFYASFARENSLLKIQEVCLVDNWDNLSSKSTFLTKPTKIGLYGKQARNHIDRIQGLEQKDTFIWGSPRYDLYLNYKYQNIQSIINKEYILYAGTSIYYDELSDLKDIRRNLNKDIEINYLPHPYRQIPKSIQKKVDQRNLVAKNIHFIERNRSRDLNQIVELTNNAKFIICGPTSMILEALICHKKVLISSRSDLNSYQRTSEIFFGYEHFDGLELNPLVRVFSEMSSIEAALEWAMKTPSKEEKQYSDSLVNYYVEININRKSILLSNFN